MNRNIDDLGAEALLAYIHEAQTQAIDDATSGNNRTVAHVDLMGKAGRLYVHLATSERETIDPVDYFDGQDIDRIIEILMDRVVNVDVPYGTVEMDNALRLLTAFNAAKRHADKKGL